MTKAITNRQLYPAIAGGLLVALVCGATLKMIHASRSSAADETTETTTVTEAEVAEDPFQSSTPFFKPSASPRLADPALLQSTPSQARVEAVTAGRPDPFAPIIRPSRPLAKPTIASVAPASGPPAPATATPPQAPVQAPLAQAPMQPPAQSTVSTVPVAATQTLPSLPALPPVPIFDSANAEASLAVAPTNSSTWASPVDQVVVSGVAQIGSTVSVIVYEPGSDTSRRVSAGETVANGQVRIKSVDLSDAEPIVVLTYDGQDYYRSVGSSALIGSL